MSHPAAQCDLQHLQPFSSNNTRLASASSPPALAMCDHGDLQLLRSICVSAAAVRFSALSEFGDYSYFGNSTSSAATPSSKQTFYIQQTSGAPKWRLRRDALRMRSLRDSGNGAASATRFLSHSDSAVCTPRRQFLLQSQRQQRCLQQQQ